MSILDLTKFFSRRQRSAPVTQSALGGNGPVFGQTQRGRDVRWYPPAEEDSLASLLVLGISGAGKTRAVSWAIGKSLLAERQRPAKQRPSRILIDPKGDLKVAVVETLSALAPELLPEVIVLSPFVKIGNRTGFAFNLNHLALHGVPLEIRAFRIAQLVGNVSTNLGGRQGLGLGARQIDVLQNVILGALDTKHPHASVLWAMDACMQKDGFDRLARLTRSVRARAFLSGVKISEDLKVSCGSRLRLALGASDALETVVTTDGCVQFDELCAPGKLVILDLGQPTGGLSSLSVFWANLFTRLCLDYLLQRASPWRGHPTRLVIDEVHLVSAIFDVAELILTTGRSRGISLVAMTQGTNLIASSSSTLLETLLTNTTAVIAGKLSAQDSERLARSQAPRRGTDEPVSAVRSRLAGTLSNLPSREFMLLGAGLREQFKTVDQDMDGLMAATRREEPRLRELSQRFLVPIPSEPRLRLEDVSLRRPINPDTCIPSGTATPRTPPPPAEPISSPPTPTPPSKKPPPRRRRRRRADDSPWG